jgi:hypothetical protein
MKRFIIASVIVLCAWLLLVRSNRVSRRFKAFITGLVVASPIPPFP